MNADIFCPDKTLREISAKNKLIDCLLSFGDNQIFLPQTTYTCLFFLSKKVHEIFPYYEVQPLLNVSRELPAILSDIETFTKVYNLDINISKLDSKSWHFFVGPTGEIFRRMDEIPLKLEQVIDRDFQGVPSGDDEVFILRRLTNTDAKDFLIAYSKASNQEIKIERQITRPLFKGSEIERYQIGENDFIIIFPYKPSWWVNSANRTLINF
ncbi:MAG: hypothetical protein OIN88_16430 [Candidatus Methanoperedens sp.]|nr:hypothetical protein [Candidatus Methanoperedens sp.]